MIKGVVRNFDHLGRICIPKEMRKSLNINEGEPVDIYINNGTLCIHSLNPQCVFCGSEKDNLIEHAGVLVCQECAHDIYGKTL